MCAWPEMDDQIRMRQAAIYAWDECRSWGRLRPHDGQRHVRLIASHLEDWFGRTGSLQDAFAQLRSDSPSLFVELIDDKWVQFTYLDPQPSADEFRCWRYPIDIENLGENEESTTVSEIGRPWSRSINSAGKQARATESPTLMAKESQYGAGGSLEGVRVVQEIAWPRLSAEQCMQQAGICAFAENRCCKAARRFNGQRMTELMASCAADWCDRGGSLRSALARLRLDHPMLIIELVDDKWIQLTYTDPRPSADGWRCWRHPVELSPPDSSKRRTS